MSSVPDRPSQVRLGTLLAFAALLAGCGSDVAPPLDGGPTSRTTIVDRDGDARLEAGPGEPLVRRGGPARIVGRPLTTVVQLSDAHVRDEESPLRLAFLDRLGPPFSSTFRPQEALTLQVLDGAVTAAREAGADAVVDTGDLADNAQRDETEQAFRALEGGRVDPGSGSPEPSGPQRAANPDPFFYRPDVDAPREPGLLARANRPFTARGAGVPWWTVPGNHDLLVQGELAPDDRLRELATGGEGVAALDLDTLRAIGRERRSAASASDVTGEGGGGGVTSADVDRVLTTADRVRVPSDPDRALVSPASRRALAERTRRGATASRFALGGGVTGIAIDTSDPGGGSGGVVSPTVLQRLRRDLRAAGGPVLAFSHHPLDDARGGEDALRALVADGDVLAAVAGHTHRHRVQRGPGGVWLVQTASLADWPVQGRVIQVVRTADGRLALRVEALDVAPGPDGLAATARELAFLDAQGGRPNGLRGTGADRNALLATTVRP